MGFHTSCYSEYVVKFQKNVLPPSSEWPNFFQVDKEDKVFPLQVRLWPRGWVEV